MIPPIYSEIGLVALTILWIGYMIRYRPRRAKKTIKQEEEKVLDKPDVVPAESTQDDLEEAAKVPDSVRGFDPMKKSLAQLKRDMLIAIAREAQKKKPKCALCGQRKDDMVQNPDNASEWYCNDCIEEEKKRQAEEEKQNE